MHLDDIDTNQPRQDAQLHELQWPTGTQRARGTLLAGLRQGEWLRWYPGERLKEIATYRHGRLHGPLTRWFPTGDVQEQLSYHQGLRHGPWARWHANGQMALDGEWLNGRPHRVFLSFWESGRRRIFGTFDQGTPVGEWRAWTEAGHLNHRACFHQRPFRDGLPMEILAAIRAETGRRRVA